MDEKDKKWIAKLATSLTAYCFRNPLEPLHCGTLPRTETGDNSDVKVVTPAGEIPWSDVSRFNNDEMKDLMRMVNRKVFIFLCDIFSPILTFGKDKSREEIEKLELRLKVYEVASHTALHTWDDPSVPLKREDSDDEI